MKVRNDNQGVLEVVSGDQWIFLVLGIPFTVMGLGFLYLMINGRMDSDPHPAHYALTSIFACIGIGFVFGRRGIAIDRLRSTVCQWYGLLGPMIRKNYRSSDFQKVTLEKVMIGEKNGRPWIVNRIQLHGNPTLTVGSDDQYEKARSISERISTMLNLPLEDSTTGTARVREASQMNSRFRPSETASARAEKAPTTLESTVKHVGSAIEIEIPAPVKAKQRAHTAAVLYRTTMVITLALWVGFNIFVMRAGTIGYVFAVLPVVFVGLNARTINKRLAAIAPDVKLTVSKTEVICIESSGKNVKTSLVRTDKIEEVFVADPQSLPYGSISLPIYIRSDEGTISFGADLSEEEKHYLVGLIQNALGGR